MTLVRPAVMGPFLVETVDDVTAIADADWPADSTPSSVFLSRNWLASQQNWHTPPSIYLILRDPDDSRIVAVVPCYLVTDPDNARTDNCPRVLLNVSHPRDLVAAMPKDEGNRLLRLSDQAAQDGLVRYPALVAMAGNGAMFGYASRTDGRHSRESVEHAIVEAFDALADELAVATRTFWYVRPTQFPGLVSDLRRHGYLPALVNADCHLDVPWPSFDGYLASLPASTRSAVRREIRRFHDAGGVVEVRGPDALDEQLARLHSELQRRHGIEVTPDAVLRAFHKVRSTIGEMMRVFVARDDTTVLGFVIVLDWRGQLYGRQAGFVHGDDVGPKFVYFNTIYYAVIHYAIDNKIRRIEYSTESYDAKQRRGCTTTPLLAYVRSETTRQAEVADYLSKYEEGVAAYLAAQGADLPRLADLPR
jgi:predicted N-acyltransferase